MQATRPFIHLNAALAAGGDHRGAISSREDLTRVHAYRERYDAIAVGAHTFEHDRPSLTARTEHLGRAPLHQPLRVVLAGTAAIDDHIGGAPLIALGPTAPRHADRWEPCPPRDIEAACAALGKLGVRTLLLEGGPTVWHAAMAAEVVDLLTVWVGEPDAIRAEALVRAHFALPPARPVRASALGGGQLVRVLFTTLFVH